VTAAHSKSEHLRGPSLGPSDRHANFLQGSDYEAVVVVAVEGSSRGRTTEESSRGPDVMVVAKGKSKHPRGLSPRLLDRHAHFLHVSNGCVVVIVAVAHGFGGAPQGTPVEVQR
jgi:hypothetical protein